MAAPGLIVVGTVESDSGLAAAADAGDEICDVDEKIAGAFGLAEGGVEQGQGGDFAAEDGGLVDGCALEAATDLGIGADAVDGAEDGDFGLLCTDGELDFERGGFARAQGDVADDFVAEAGFGNRDRVGAC